MAKSIRSKRKRKMRNIKRKRYAEKEMKRLKAMLGLERSITNENVKMRVSHIAPVVEGNDFTLNGKEKETVKNEFEEKVTKMKYMYDVRKVKIESESSSEEDSVERPMLSTLQDSTGSEINMDTSNKRIFNPKTMRDQNGTYPIWFTKKDKKKQKMKEKIKHRKLKRLQNVEERLNLLMNKQKKNSKARRKRKAMRANQLQN